MAHSTRRAAENRANYQIVGPAGRRTKVVSAIYDPATDTVTLVPAERISIHRAYRLTIFGTAPHRAHQILRVS